MKICKKNYNLNLFKLINNEYVYQENLDEHYYCVIKIIDDELKVSVYDSTTNEEYIPFNIKSNLGSFSASIHELVDKIIDKLKIDNSSIVQELFEYIHNKYNIEPNYPFPKDRISATFNKNKKWFLLYMNIPAKLLGINSLDNINIINIKLKENKIPKLIDNKIFFKAYHMNKKHWITINLDNVLSINEIDEYIDTSFNLV